MVPTSPLDDRYRSDRSVMKPLLLLALIIWPVYLNSAVVVVSGSENNPQLRTYTGKVLQESLPLVTFFPQSDTIHIEVAIATSPAEFHHLVGSYLPDWVTAVTLYPQRKIIVKAPQLTRSTLREYRTTLRHELVHLLQSHLLPLNLTPRWFNEGLAIYYSEGLAYHRRLILSRAIFRKRLLDLMQSDHWSKYSATSADLAYAESAAAVEFLITIYGVESLTQIFRQMRQGQSFEDCLSEITQNDYADFPNLFSAYLRSRYSWLILTDLQSIFWLFLSLMVVIIYWYLRKKKQLKMAEVEEAGELNSSDE